VTLTDPLYRSAPAAGCSAPQAAGSPTLTGADTTTAVGSSANPSVAGDAVTFSATVSAAAAGLGVPTGAVTFYDGATALGTAALDGAGQATLTTASLSAGAHAITAAYPGDPNFAPSSSTTLTQKVKTRPYDFTGFFPPVDNPPALNVVEAGSAVPVKFGLGGDKGLDIFAPRSPSLEFLASCPRWAPHDTVGETVGETVATTGYLAFDAGRDQYVYVWKTERSWAGRCGRLRVTLSDGSEHTALFRFKEKLRDKPDDDYD
jgi:hypothetical protein